MNKSQSSSSEAASQPPRLLKIESECHSKKTTSEDNSFYDAIMRPASRIITSIKANTQISIARKAKITYSHTVKTLLTMKKNGLITITKKGRNTRITLTKKGLALHNKITEIQSILQCTPE